MAQDRDKKEKKGNQVLPAKFNLTVRLLVGFYLLYTSYSLIDGVMNGEGRDKYFFGAFMIFFTFMGILLIVFSGRDLMRGRYVGGAMDTASPEESEIDAEAAAGDADAAEPAAEDADGEKTDREE